MSEPTEREWADYQLIRRVHDEQHAIAVDGEAVREYLERLVEPEAVFEMAQIIGRKLAAQYPGSAIPPEVLGGLWVSGFQTGMGVQHELSQRGNPSVPDDLSGLEDNGGHD